MPRERKKENIMPKQKYLCIQRSQPGKGEKLSPAQMEEMYAKFHAWMEKFQKNIVDMGGKLGGGSVVTSKGATDGPIRGNQRGDRWLHDRLGGQLGGGYRSGS